VIDIDSEAQRRNWHAGLAGTQLSALLILRSGVFAASRRMRSIVISWFETALVRLLTMRE
jgi:hypothetical protein